MLDGEEEEEDWAGEQEQKRGEQEHDQNDDMRNLFRRLRLSFVSVFLCVLSLSQSLSLWLSAHVRCGASFKLASCPGAGLFAVRAGEL